MARWKKATLEQSNPIGSVGPHTLKLCVEGMIFQDDGLVSSCGPCGITGQFIKESKTQGLLFVPAMLWEIAAHKKGYSGSSGVLRKQNMERKQRHIVFKSLTDRRETPV